MKRGNQFLIACIRLWGQEDAEAIEAVRNLAESAPPDVLYSVAHDSHLAPVAYYVLRKREFIDMLPDPLPDQLRQFYHFTAARNAVIFRNLKAFLDGAENCGFPVMLLKGSALIAGGYYPDKGLRFLSDLDVLVKREDVGAADNLLHDLGWHAPVRIPLNQQLKLHHHLSTVTTPEGIPVEVHFALSRLPLKLDLDKMWERSRPIETLGPAARAPSPEDILIHIALNTSMHHPDRLLQLHLKFLADLEALLHSQVARDLDWDYIFDTASSAGLEVAVLHPLALSHKLLNHEALGTVLVGRQAYDRIDSDFVDRLARNMMEGTEIPETSWMVARMGEAHGARGKLKVFMRMVFPPWAEMSEIYPSLANSPWHFLAYLHRVGHLIANFRWRNFSLAYHAGSVLNKSAENQTSAPSDR